jgi:heme exporter protein B
MLHLPHDQLPVLLLSLLLGTPLLSLIGGVVAALTVGIRRSGILVALLSCRCTCRCWCSAPAASAAGRGQDPAVRLLMLGAGLAVALVLAPLATRPLRIRWNSLSPACPA